MMIVGTERKDRRDSSQGVMKEAKSHTKYKYHLREREGKKKKRNPPHDLLSKVIILAFLENKERKVREL